MSSILLSGKTTTYFLRQQDTDSMIINLIASFKSIMSSTLNSSDKRAKIQDCDFIIGLIQSLATAKGNFTLSELRLSVCQYIGITIEKSAFNERVGTTSLVSHLTFFLKHLMSTAFASSSDFQAVSLAKKLKVKEVIGVDSSMVTLWDGLSEVFPGTFMNSSVKLHMATNLITGAVNWFDITPGSTNDSKHFPISHPGKLYIFDLGYWSYKRLTELSDNSSFFLSRVKSNAGLRVSRVIYGIGQSAIGQDLLKIPFHRKRGKVIEVYAVASIDGEKKEFRILGFWNKENKSYHWYLTNIKGNRKIIADLYKLRWQIELSFKALKSTLNFDRMPTSKENTVKVFVLISLINYLFSIVFKNEASSKLKTHTSIQKAAKAYRVGVQLIFEKLRIGKRLTLSWIKGLERKLIPLYKYIINPDNKHRNPIISDFST